MLFSIFTSTLFVTFAALNAIASPAPVPAPAPEPVPEPAPIPPELQPLIAAKDNLAGTAVDAGDPRFNTTLSYSNGVAMPQIPMAFVASITAGTVLAALV